MGLSFWYRFYMDIMLIKRFILKAKEMGKAGRNFAYLHEATVILVADQWHLA